MSPVPQIQTASVSRSDFKPAPIEPSWILQGNPTARSVPLARGENGNFSCGLWECTAGRFKYIFPVDEIIQVLEGEVFIQEDGAEHTLRPGDTAHFPQGLVTYWTVSSYVKKFAIFHSPTRSFFAKVVRKLKKLTQRPAAPVKEIQPRPVRKGSYA